MNQENYQQVRIVLFQVKIPNEKLTKLAETCASHFEKKEPIILFFEDEKAVQFTDEFLWKYPASSFLPHTVEGRDIITITSGKKNINEARVAFNLCATPLLIEGFKMIYDFEDLSTPSKKQFSSLRFDAYKREGHLIESR